MKKLGLILMVIGLCMIVIGLCSMIVEPIVNKHICDNTTNISWYLENCVDKR